VKVFDGCSKENSTKYYDLFIHFSGKKNIFIFKKLILSFDLILLAE
jgi:hypothetical protein